MRKSDDRPGLTSEATREGNRRECVASNRRSSAGCNAGRIYAATVHTRPPARETVTSRVTLVVAVPETALIRPHLTRNEDERPIHRRENVSWTQAGDVDTDRFVSP